MLPRLIESLRVRGPLERSESELASLFAESRASWPFVPRLVTRSGTYTRTCAHQNPRFEILLLNWFPGAVSAIHDHGGQHCWMFVLEGRLEVEDYLRVDAGDRPATRKSNRATRASLSRAGWICARDASTFIAWRLRETRRRRYGRSAGPLRQFLIYHEFARRCETVFGAYDDMLPAYPEPARR